MDFKFESRFKNKYMQILQIQITVVANETYLRSEIGSTWPCNGCSLNGHELNNKKCCCFQISSSFCRVVKHQSVSPNTDNFVYVMLSYLSSIFVIYFQRGEKSSVADNIRRTKMSLLLILAHVKLKHRSQKLWLSKHGVP